MITSAKPDLAAVVDDIQLPPEFSDEALALRFSEQHSDDLRFTAAWAKWSLWNGVRWLRDDTLHVFDMARTITRTASSECSERQNEGVARRVASAQSVAAVERLARADRRHAATVEMWDADLWLLNTPTGVVDLHTGRIQEHRREHYITKMTAVGPGGDCPLWLRFLHRITDDDRELESFLQRMIGYALTGSTREHALFFLYGVGANGKSVFLTTISGLLADYAKTAATASFTASRTEQHPTDLAGLCGARFVTAIETESDRRWAEAKIKALTGGDKISARYMRQDFFEFVPAFKLVVAGNHKPGLRTVDEAIKRRLHLIPFTVTIPEHERDKNLAEKLQTEWPGILAWAINGALDWQRTGLKPPTAVRKATEDYFADEDTFGRWLGECCVLGSKYQTTSAALFENYRSWAESAGEYVISQRRFSRALQERGITLGRTAAHRFLVGVAPRPDAER